jgi:hypothetical protein
MKGEFSLACGSCRAIWRKMSLWTNRMLDDLDGTSASEVSSEREVRRINRIRRILRIEVSPESSGSEALSRLGSDDSAVSPTMAARDAARNVEARNAIYTQDVINSIDAVYKKRLTRKQNQTH